DRWAFCRVARTRRPSVSLMSTRALSSAVRSRNSSADATRHPAASSFFFLRLSTSVLLCGSVVTLETQLTLFDDPTRCGSRRLAKNCEDHTGVGIKAIHDSPCGGAAASATVYRPRD